MKRKIPKDEFLHLAPEYPGKARAIHQSDHCTAGSDSKALLIERKDDGTVSAYCFRCAGSGYWAPANHYLDSEERRKRLASSSGRADGRRTGYAIPDDLTRSYPSFSREAREWLGKAGITQTIAERYEMGWSEEERRLWMPVWQEGLLAHGPKLVGHVLRGFQPKSYLTRTTSPEDCYGLYRASEGHSSDGEDATVIIVEDLLSGLRCSEVADTLVLCGTSLRPKAYTTLVQEGYKKAVVFLDADNPTVRANSRKIVKSLSWMEVKNIETGKDPKYYSRDRLEELINDDEPRRTA